jgi:hypothetical protein
MNREINLPFKHTFYSHFNLTINTLNDFMVSYQSNTELPTGVYKATKHVFDLTHQRKVFENAVASLLADFSKQDESVKLETELYFYNALKKLDQLNLIANQEIHSSSLLVFHRFLLRELKKTVSTLSEAQETMFKALYSDNTNKILADPVLYNQLVVAWGDLANDGY